MKYSTSDLISKCVKGRVPKDIIDELREEEVDAQVVIRELAKDLMRVDVKVETCSTENNLFIIALDEEHNTDPSMYGFVLDTYSNLYSEFTFVVSNK